MVCRVCCIKISDHIRLHVTILYFCNTGYTEPDFIGTVITSSSNWHCFRLGLRFLETWVSFIYILTFSNSLSLSLSLQLQTFYSHTHSLFLSLFLCPSLPLNFFHLNNETVFTILAEWGNLVLEKEDLVPAKVGFCQRGSSGAFLVSEYSRL